MRSAIFPPPCRAPPRDVPAPLRQYSRRFLRSACEREFPQSSLRKSSRNCTRIDLTNAGPPNLYRLSLFDLHIHRGDGLITYAQIAGATDSATIFQVAPGKFQCRDSSSDSISHIPAVINQGNTALPRYIFSASSGCPFNASCNSFCSSWHGTPSGGRPIGPPGRLPRTSGNSARR